MAETRPTLQTNGAPFSACTEAAASSFRIRRMWAARGCCRASASRRLPRPAPDLHGRKASGSRRDARIVIAHFKRWSRRTRSRQRRLRERLRAMRPASQKASGSRSTPASRDSGSKTRPATRHVRCSAWTCSRRTDARCATHDGPAAANGAGRRSEGFIRAGPIDGTIARLKAYSKAGADCFSRPAPLREQIAAVVPQSRRNRWTTRRWQAEFTVRTSPRSACGALASAARSRAPHREDSCALPSSCRTGNV